MKWTSGVMRLRYLAERLETLVIRLCFATFLLVCLGGALWLSDGFLELGLEQRMKMFSLEIIQRAEPIMYVYDPRCGWKMNPHIEYHRKTDGPFFAMFGGEPIDARIRTNADGFLDREHALETPHYRIAMVGDSWVEAVQHDETNRFSYLTEDRVYRYSKGEKAVEVMNFGVSNLGPAQEYGIIKHWVLKYRPDEVWLFFFSGNDLGDCSQVLTAPPLGPTYVYAEGRNDVLADIRFGFVDPPAMAHERRMQRYGKFIESFSNFALEVLPYYYSQERHPTFEQFWVDTLRCFPLIKALLDRAGSKFRVVYIPSPLEVDERLWPRFVADARRTLNKDLALEPSAGEARLAEALAQAGIDFISLTPLIREKGRREMIADHFSRMGHHWTADFLAERVISSMP